MQHEEYKKGEDYKVAMGNIKVFFNDMRREFGDCIKGISVWGSVTEKFFMFPVDTTGLSDEKVKLIRKAGLPIAGESKGSDIDATLYVDEDRMVDVAKYLSKRIDELDDDLRFEHVTVASYDGALDLFSKLRVYLDGLNDFPRRMKGVKCFLIMSQNGQVKNKMGDLLKDNLMETARSTAFFEDAYRGFNHGMDAKLKALLEVTPAQRSFLEKRYERWLREHEQFRMARNEKLKRFEKLEKILGS